MRHNLGWFLLGATTGLLFFSASYNLVQNREIEDLNKQLLSIEFDQDVCNRRIIELTSHEREPKK
jgi:hypothetical protein